MVAVCGVKRLTSLPDVATVAVIALNLGLVLRVIAEPLERAGQASELTLTTLAASALLQLGAVLVFVIQMWPRLGARQIRGRERTAA